MRSATKWTAWVGTDDQWDEQLRTLSGACVFQGSKWARHRADFGWKSVRLISETGRCYAQVLYKTVLGTSIAWIPGGPTGDIDEIGGEFVTMIRRLTNSSRIYVRVNILKKTNQAVEKSLVNSQWRRVRTKLSSGFSLTYSLQADETTRRNDLSTNWGRNLRRGESRNQTPYIWTQVSSQEIADLYKNLSDYKDLADSGEIPGDESIKSLIHHCKNDLYVFRCDDETGELLAIRGALRFGRKAWDIFAAVSPKGRKQYSSYVTAWSLLNFCAEQGVDLYDLSGIDPINNKGVYDFKHGTGATEVEYVGEWEFGSPFFVQPIVGRLIRYRKTF